MPSTQQEDWWMHTQEQKKYYIASMETGRLGNIRAGMVEEKAFGCCGKVKMCDHVSVLNIDGIHVKIRLIIIIMCSLLIICTVNTQ